MTDLNILSGGAAQGLVQRLAPEFKTLTGANISGDFGAVGAMAAKLRGGTPADMVILTDALVKELVQQRLVETEAFAVGSVATSVAVRSSDPVVAVKNADDLREVLLAADEIYAPDMEKSTAGIHVANVLVKLGISEEVAPRLKVFPNGATAMRHLSASGAKRAIGCTQSTEILNTPGVLLVGPLPQGYDLATTYTAAVTSNASDAGLARQLIDLLVDPRHRELREKLGFVETRR
jgi:molybdate transport system substrate-binding protein